MGKKVTGQLLRILLCAVLASCFFSIRSYATEIDELEKTTEALIDGEISVEEAREVLYSDMGIESESTPYLTHSQILAKYYYDNDTLSNYLMRRDYPYIYTVEKRENNKSFKNAEAYWQMMKFVNGDYSSCSEEEMIVIVLYSILKDDIEENTSNGNTKRITDSAILDTTITLADDICSTYNNNLANIYDGVNLKGNTEEVNLLAKSISKNLNMNKYFSVAGDVLFDIAVVKELIGTCVDIYDVIKSVGIMKASLSIYGSYAALFTEMANNTSDSATKEALTIMADMCSGTTIDTIKGQFALGRTTKNSVLVMSTFLESTLVTNPVGFSLLAGFKLTDLGYNMLFSTDEYSEVYYRMKRLYDIDKALNKVISKYSKAVGTDNNITDAALFVSAVEFKQKVVSEGLNYQLEWYGLANEDKGWIGNLFRRKLSDDKYIEAEDSINIIVSEIEWLMYAIRENAEVYYQSIVRDTISNSMYNNSDILNDIDIVEPLGSDEINGRIESTIEKTKYFQNIIVEKGEKYVLYEDIDTEGMIIVNNGVLDLNGYTIKCKGDVNVNGGYIIFNGGSISTSGDFNIGTENPDWNGDGLRPAMSTGTIIMNNPGDMLNVEGGMTICSNGADRPISQGDVTLKEGTINVKGDFNYLVTQSAHDEDEKCYNAVVSGGNNKIVFCGNEKQTIKSNTTNK